MHALTLSGAHSTTNTAFVRSLVRSFYLVRSRSRSSSIIKRYCEGYFTPNYKLTIGVDFAVKVVEWDEHTSVSLQVRSSPVCWRLLDGDRATNNATAAVASTSTSASASRASRSCGMSLATSVSAP